MKLITFFLFFIFNLSFSQEKFEIFFDSNSDIPNLTSREIFNIWMYENSNVEIIRISGYCDNIDSYSNNKDLASRRIKSILEDLKERKIKINTNVVIENYGENFKQSLNQSLNRKVVIYYKKNVFSDTLANTIKKSKREDLIMLENIYFDYSSAKFLPESYNTLNVLLQVLKENPKLIIEIQGHICCQNSYQPDIISTERAKAIYTYLIQNKIDKKRLTYKGYGVTRPIHPIPEKNTQEEEENRRVEIMIVEN